METITLFNRGIRSRAGVALLTTGLLALALAGCGGDAEAEKPQYQVPAKVEKAYNKCMKDAGYPQVGDGTLGKPGKDPLWKDKDFLAAQQKCQESSGINDYGPGPGHGKVDRKKQDKQTLAMTKCLRGKGWDLDDPKREDDGVLGLDIPSLDSEEQRKAFMADFEACAKKVGVRVDDGDSPGGNGDHGGDDGHEG